MKIISWNVNGIRASIKKGFMEFLEDQDPDIILLQEVKAQRDQVDVRFEDMGLHVGWNSAVKKGYSGVAIFSKIKPLSVSLGIDKKEHDQEGRVITFEYDNFYLVNVYTPNSKDELKRLDYRMEWDKEFLSFVKSLEKSKPVIFGGDLNVAHKEIDLARPKQNERSPGFSIEEREGFNNIVKSGFIDTFRYFNPNKKDIYSWWSYRARARVNNVGWRIDYFCVSPELIAGVNRVDILTEVMGSDHCPVLIELKS